jgi:hypothetical protein
MDSLFNILMDKDFGEPAESLQIKKYIKKNYGIKVGVQVRQKDIVLIVANSAIAGSLRLGGPLIKHDLGITKKLTFRING